MPAPPLPIPDPVQSLLSGIGDGEEELVANLLNEESPELKVIIAVGASVVVTAGGCVACWLCGLDPLGR
jgi:hypothetical protein